MAKNVSLILDMLNVKVGNRKIYEPYIPCRALDVRISADERAKTKSLFEFTQKQLHDNVFDMNVLTAGMLKVAAPAIGALTFDLDAGTRPMLKAVEDAGIRFGLNKFMQTLF